jgi:HAD superfamily hydrolase (TIGR01549 family)
MIQRHITGVWRNFDSQQGIFDSRRLARHCAAASIPDAKFLEKTVALENIRWVFFDLGCTLIDESAALSDAHDQLVNALSERHIHVTTADIENALTPAWQSFQPSPIMHVLTEITGDRDDARSVLKQVKYQKSLETPYTETKALLDALSDRYKIGVIANQSPGTEARLKSYSLYDYFTICLASAEEGAAKPEPILFHRALEQSNCAPEHAVMVGDRIDNDVRPAKALGWRTIRILQGHGRLQSPRDDDDIADHTVITLDEITPLFAL